jgi:hypothetical protein
MSILPERIGYYSSTTIGSQEYHVCGMKVSSNYGDYIDIENHEESKVNKLIIKLTSQKGRNIEI